MTESYWTSWLIALLVAACVLGLCALVTRLMTQRAVAQSPPEGKFVDANGVRLHYTEHGLPNRAAVVLVRVPPASLLDAQGDR
jgi:hypothetical protein